jgi:tetratricopeptide (TPR) repeat protein
MQQHIGAFVLELPLAARLANAVVSVPRYIGKFLWPTELTVCYPHPGYWPGWIVAGAAVFALAVTVMAWKGRHRSPWILAGWLAFLVMLLPAIGIIQVGFQSMADRYTYLPILGIQLALIWTLPAVSQWKMPPWWVVSAAGIWLVVLAGRTWNQQATWRDPIAMFEHALSVTERNETAHALLGYTLLTVGKLDEAQQHSQRALEINPRNHTALFTLASVRDAMQRSDEAIAAYRSALQVKPDDPESSYRLGLLLVRTGQPEEGTKLIAKGIAQNSENYRATLTHALAQSQGREPATALAYFQAALMARPDDPDAHYGLGLALNKLGRSTEAKQHLENAIAARPQFAEAHTELGLILFHQGDLDAAARHFRAALQSAPTFVVALLGLGQAAEKLGNTVESTASFTEALRLAPNEATPHRVWADILARRKNFDAAIRHYERAAELDPKSAQTRAALGFALFLSGRRDEGIARWKEALALDPNFPGLRERLQRYQ